MSVQVRRRREAAVFLQSFVGAQGELLVDTTNNRLQVHDGATPGGWPAARLADLPTSTNPLALASGGTGVSAANTQALAGALGIVGRTTVADANYTALVTDRLVAFTALTAPRTLTLPPATAFPAGVTLTVVDESGACSATAPITVAAAGTDRVNAGASASIVTAFGYLALESNGVGRWTIIDAVAAPSQMRAANAYLGALGHSMLDQANGNFGTAPNIDTQFTVGSFPWWVNFLSRGRYVADRQSWLGAVSGTTTQQMANSTQITNAVASRASVIVAWLSTNDRPAGFTLDDGTTAVLGSAGTATIPNVKAMINALVAAGKFVLLLADPPRGSSTYTTPRLTGSQLAYHGQYRAWVINTAPKLWPGSVFAIDTWPDGASTVSGTLGDVRDGYTRDGLHPATLYAPPIAKRALAVLDELGVPTRQVPVLSTVDAWAAASPTGAVAPSTRLGGTGSSAGSASAAQGGVTYSGARSSGYGIQANTPAQAGTLTVTMTRNVASPQSGGQADWFELDIQGTTAASAGPVIQMQYSLTTSDKAALAVGDRLTIFGEFEVDQGGVGLRSVDFQLLRTTPSKTERIRCANVDNTMGALDTYLASAPMSGFHDGGGLYVTVDGTETDISLFWLWQLVESAAPSVKTRIRNPVVRKVL